MNYADIVSAYAITLMYTAAMIASILLVIEIK